MTQGMSTRRFSMRKWLRLARLNSHPNKDPNLSRKVRTLPKPLSKLIQTFLLGPLMAPWEINQKTLTKFLKSASLETSCSTRFKALKVSQTLLCKTFSSLKLITSNPTSHLSSRSSMRTNRVSRRMQRLSILTRTTWRAKSWRKIRIKVNHHIKISRATTVSLKTKRFSRNS